MNHVEPKKGGKTKIAVVVATAALAVGFGMLLIGFYICRSSTNLKGKTTPLRQPFQTYSTVVLWNYLESFSF